MGAAIESLFAKSWITNNHKILFLVLYIPMGILLMTLRIFISLQLLLASLLLPKGTTLRKFVLRVLYTIMGVVVIEKGKILLANKQDKKPRLIIANHITPFDHLAVSLVYPCCSISVYNLPSIVSSLLCYEDFGVSQGKEALKSNIRSYLDKPNSLPVLLHPEGATTNGKVALMKYNSWAFEIDDDVLLVGMRVKRIPFLPISLSVLGGSWGTDLFYLLFSPLTIFTVRYVSHISREKEESAELFALRAQAETALVLKLQITSHTVGDKMEYIKRLAREEAAASNPFLNPEIHAMALQVKEILPYLPLDTIKRDLIRTRNVDSTISNFLEGPETVLLPSSTPSNIQAYTSALASSSSTGSPTSKVQVLDNQTFNLGEKIFGKSANDRTLSFHERKMQLIETARRKYIEKHDLKISDYNC